MARSSSFQPASRTPQASPGKQHTRHVSPRPTLNHASRHKGIASALTRASGTQQKNSRETGGSVLTVTVMAPMAVPMKAVTAWCGSIMYEPIEVVTAAAPVRTHHTLLCQLSGWRSCLTRQLCSPHTSLALLLFRASRNAERAHQRINAAAIGSRKGCDAIPTREWKSATVSGSWVGARPDSSTHERCQDRTWRAASRRMLDYRWPCRSRHRRRQSCSQRSGRTPPEKARDTCVSARHQQERAREALGWTGDWEIAPRVAARPEDTPMMATC